MCLYHPLSSFFSAHTVREAYFITAIQGLNLQLPNQTHRRENDGTYEMPASTTAVVLSGVSAIWYHASQFLALRTCEQYDQQWRRTGTYHASYYKKMQTKVYLNTAPIFCIAHISSSEAKRLTNEEYCLLVCDAMLSGKNLPTFRKNVLPPFSGHITLLSWRQRHHVLPKSR
jgi:hypothetical protein